MPVMRRMKNKVYPSKRSDKLAPTVGNQSKVKAIWPPEATWGKSANAKPNKLVVTPTANQFSWRRRLLGKNGRIAPDAIGKTKKIRIISALTHDTSGSTYSNSTRSHWFTVQFIRARINGESSKVYL